MSNNNEDESLRKLFIGGIKLDTTDETFHDYYAKFGEVVDSVIMKDAHTQRSRGFGFVTYASKEAVDAAMSMRPHVIDDKPVDVKRAIPKDAINKNESNISSKRLYVSGIKEGITQEELEKYFSEFGEVEKVELILNTDGQPRGFAFVSFHDYDPVDKCVLQRTHVIGEHRCETKKALNKEETARAQTQRDRTMRYRQSRSEFGAGHPPHGGPPVAYGAPSPWASGYAPVPPHYAAPAHMAGGYPQHVGAYGDYAGYAQGYGGNWAAAKPAWGGPPTGGAGWNGGGAQRF